jgi:hypothetical protein
MCVMDKRLKMAGMTFLVLAGAGLMAALDRRSPDAATWFSGWLAYSLLLGAAGVSLGWVLRRLGADRNARRAAWTAFLLRLGVGLALVWLLPAFGYAENEASQAGYLFKDAAMRDDSAWLLAGSDAPLWQAFSGGVEGDQYGGLLALSAGVYRYLSPAAHRPLLIVLLAGWAVGLGTALLWAAGRGWFAGQGSAVRLVPAVSAWVMALYPEGVLLGASQMREPFAMAAIAACFYGLVEVGRDRGEGEDPHPAPQTAPTSPGARGRAHGREGWLALVLGLAALFLLQPPAALAVLMVLGGLWLLDAAARRHFSWRALLLLGGALALALVFSILLWMRLPGLEGERGLGVVFAWLEYNFGFQSHLTERASGILQSMIRVLGERWTLPLVIVYGFAQPVLPAALVEPSLPLWMTLNSLRAAGWYALAPFLIYGLVSAFHPASQKLRGQRLWLSLVVFAWIVVSAVNAGGDMWDNPRYRTIFLPWMALLAAWALWGALQRRDAWLWRWIAVEVVFVLFFLWWYISRYYPGMFHLSIWMTSGLTLSLAGLILLGGWLWDRRKRSK